MTGARGFFVCKSPVPRSIVGSVAMNETVHEARQEFEMILGREGRRPVLGRRIDLFANLFTGHSAEASLHLTS